MAEQFTEQSFAVTLSGFFTEGGRKLFQQFLLFRVKLRWNLDGHNYVLVALTAAVNVGDTFAA